MTDLCDLANNHKFKLGSVELSILFAELSERVKEQTDGRVVL